MSGQNRWTDGYDGKFQRLACNMVQERLARLQGVAPERIGDEISVVLLITSRDDYLQDSFSVADLMGIAKLFDRILERIQEEEDERS